VIVADGTVGRQTGAAFTRFSERFDGGERTPVGRFAVDIPEGQSKRRALGFPVHLYASIDQWVH
jgi:hypothetical protein